jgi:hypothetical protein
VSVFECIAYRLSRTIGAAPAEKTDAGLDKTHGLRVGRAVIPGLCESENPESRDSGFDANGDPLASPRNDEVLNRPDVRREGVDFRTQQLANGETSETRLTYQRLCFLRRKFQ